MVTMKYNLLTNWRKNLSPRFDGRDGLHAIAFLSYMILVELASTAVWFCLSTALVSFDKFLLMRHFLTPNEALGAAVVIVFGLGIIIYGGLLGTQKGKQFMLAKARAIDKFVIKAIFEVRFFFVSVTYADYPVLSIHFQTRIPSLPDMPPRRHLA